MRRTRSFFAAMESWRGDHGVDADFAVRLATELSFRVASDLAVSSPSSLQN